METHELVGYAVMDGIRTARHTYVEYGTGERELYDLAADPYQTKNIARDRRSGPGRGDGSAVGGAEELRRGCLPHARGFASRARADARGGAWHACEGLTSPRRHREEVDRKARRHAYGQSGDRRRLRRRRGGADAQGAHARRALRSGRRRDQRGAHGARRSAARRSLSISPEASRARRSRD